MANQNHGGGLVIMYRSECPVKMSGLERSKIYTHLEHTNCISQVPL